MKEIDLSSIAITDLIQFIAIFSAFSISVISLFMQNRNTIKLKYIEVDLTKKIFEHQEQFQKLHEKRFQVIIELYRQIVIIEMWIMHILQDTEATDIAYGSKRAFGKSMEDAFGNISLKMQYLACYFNLNRIYLNDSIVNKLLDFSNFALDESDMLENYFYYVSDENVDSEIIKGKLRQLKVKATKYVKQIVSIRSEIELEFKKALGVYLTKEEINTIRTDLMWVPEPRIIENLTDNKE